MALPLNITSFGVNSDKLGDKFFIFFFSIHSNNMLYLGDEELTHDLSKALKSDDMQFITEELGNLLQDEMFMEYLEGQMVL